MATFPANRMRLLSERWRLSASVINGGVTAGGLSPMSRTDGGGLWVCEQTFLLATSDERKAARAFEAQMDAGAVSVEVPCFVGPDGPTDGYALNIAFADPAALRATTATVAVTVGQPLTGGEVFTVDHPTRGKRRYVVATAGALTSGEQTITFRPPLREAVTNEALDLQSPSCVMRLANPDEFMGALGLEKVVEVSAVWIESFDAA